MKNKLKAFTLAEVLITLGIIGVVAAITIPTMINNHERRQLETALRRSYSLINQALDMHHAKTGDRLTSLIGQGAVKPILMQYMKVIKDCGAGQVLCKSPQNTKIQDVYKNFSGTANIGYGFYRLMDDGQFVLNDGSYILLENGPDFKVFISVDVNGYEKGPNRAGIDLFMFQVNENGKLLAMGASGTDYYNNKDYFCSQTSADTKNGLGCTYKALTDPYYFKKFIKF